MGGLFSKPKMPPPPKTVRMPVPEDSKIQEAKKLDRTKRAQRRGRQASILTETGSTDKLGAG